MIQLEPEHDDLGLWGFDYFMGGVLFVGTFVLLPYLVLVV